MTLFHCLRGLALLLPFCLLAAHPGRAQTTAAALAVKFSAAQLQADVDSLTAQLRRLHPALYRHRSPAVVGGAFARVRRSFTDSLTALEFYRRLAPALATVGCGHTRLLPSEAVAQALAESGRYFPLPVRCLGRRVYVDVSDQGPPQLARLRVLNGARVGPLARRLACSFALDGRPRAGRYLFLDNFAPSYARLVAAAPTHFELRARRRGRRLTRRVAAVSLDSLLAARKRRGLVYGSGGVVPIAQDFAGPVPVLRIRNFNARRYAQYQIDFAEFLNAFFTEARHRNAPAIIIDLRGNGGGDDAYGALLFAHLSPGLFRYFRAVVQKTPSGEAPVDHPQLAPQAPVAPTYAGQVLVLTDGLTFSTAADFCAVFRHQRRGLLIGAETGGGYQGNTSGQSVDYRLPYSGLVADLPLWRYTSAVSGRYAHRGVPPHVRVRPRRRDVEQGHDRALRVALRRLTR